MAGSRSVCRSYPNKKAPAKPGPSKIATVGRSARIEFDDQMRLHLHRERHIRQRGHADELRRHLAVVDFEEIGRVALGKLAGFKHMRELLGGLLDLDEVAELQLVAAGIDPAAFD